jgi:hypothetical protein
MVKLKDSLNFHGGSRCFGGEAAVEGSSRVGCAQRGTLMMRMVRAPEFSERRLVSGSEPKGEGELSVILELGKRETWFCQGKS